MLKLRVKVARPRSRGGRTPRNKALAIAQGLRWKVDQKVLRGGQPVGGRPAYANHGAVKVPTDYATGGTTQPSGVSVFRNSAALRAGRGYGNTSGGMRRGLIVKTKGGGRAVVMVDGSSQGANPVWVGGQAQGQTVSNQEKASTILEVHNRNILELSDEDIRAVRDAALEWLRRHVGEALGGRIRWQRKQRVGSSLARKILRG